MSHGTTLWLSGCCGVAVALGALLGVAADGARAAEVTLGRSAEGRPITATRLGSAAAPTPVLVVGSIHGDEPGGLAVIRRLVRRAPPSGVELWAIPTINPDGLARGTRQNARGVDLNRNFPFRWRPQGSRGSTFYSGPRPASEHETRLAVRLIRRLRPAVTVWFHQPFGLVDRGSGSDPALAPLYARSSGLPFGDVGAFLPGIATRWQTRTIPDTTAFVVELPAGVVSAAAVSRHVRALRLVARRAAGRRGRGTAEADRLVGTARADLLDGRAGDDTLLGRSGGDTLDGGPGDDRLDGGAGDDRLRGDAGEDALLGGRGDDVLVGGPGMDSYAAGGGNDRILARDGIGEPITCGRGRDVVRADADDRAAPDCERVIRPAGAAPTPPPGAEPPRGSATAVGPASISRTARGAPSRV